MGTEVRVSAWTNDEQRAVRAFEQVFDEFDRLDRLLSVWHPDSDVSRINTAAGRERVRVERETLDGAELKQLEAEVGNGDSTLRPALAGLSAQ